MNCKSTMGHYNDASSRNNISGMFMTDKKNYESKIIVGEQKVMTKIFSEVGKKTIQDADLEVSRLMQSKSVV